MLIDSHDRLLLSSLATFLSLSHNNPCFPCNIAITTFLVSHTCKIRHLDRTVGMLHHDVIQHKNSKTWPNEYILDPYFFNLIRWITDPKYTRTGNEIKSRLIV